MRMRSSPLSFPPVKGFSHVLAARRRSLVSGPLVGEVPEVAPGARQTPAVRIESPERLTIPVGETADVRLTLVNASDRPVRLRSLRTSCGCTKVRSLPGSLGAGARVDLSAVAKAPPNVGRRELRFTLAYDAPATGDEVVAKASTVAVYVGRPVLELLSDDLVFVAGRPPGTPFSVELPFRPAGGASAERLRVTGGPDWLKVSTRPGNGSDGGGSVLVAEGTVPAAGGEHRGQFRITDPEVQGAYSLLDYLVDVPSLFSVDRPVTVLGGAFGTSATRTVTGPPSVSGPSVTVPGGLSAFVTVTVTETGGGTWAVRVASAAPSPEAKRERVVLRFDSAGVQHEVPLTLALMPAAAGQ